MNLLDNPRIRVAIVVIITTVIAIGIGLLMSSLLTPRPKHCKGDTHLDPNTNKCLPKCQTGYKNDPITGECIIDCPKGEVSSKSISGVTIPGKERCVVPCGSGACDPETEQNVCHESTGACYKPNCKTTANKFSYCLPPLLCGTDSDGKKKTILPADTKLDEDGCYKQVTPPTPSCLPPTPNLVVGTGSYANHHICCKTSEFGTYTKEGEPFCCSDKEDVIIDRKCCPKDKQCPKENPTYCLKDNEVCTDEGKCDVKKAIGKPGNYTGCCPFPTSNGKCYNMCSFAGEDETGMKSTCITDSDCDFKPGFSFDGIQTAGGKCDGGKCKLYCGPADVDMQGSVVCLNDNNINKSSCIDTSNMCKYDLASYHPAVAREGEENIYICEDDTQKVPISYWKSKSGVPKLTTTLNQSKGSGPCSAMSCLERTISSGMLSDNVSIISY